MPDHKKHSDSEKDTPREQPSGGSDLAGRLQTSADHKSRQDLQEKTRAERQPENRLSLKTAGRGHFGECAIADVRECGKDKNTIVHMKNGLPEKIQHGEQHWQRDGKNPQVWHVNDGDKVFKLKAEVRVDKNNDLITKVKHESSGTESTYKNGEARRVSHEQHVDPKEANPRVEAKHFVEPKHSSEKHVDPKESPPRVEPKHFVEPKHSSDHHVDPKESHPRVEPKHFVEPKHQSDHHVDPKEAAHKQLARVASNSMEIPHRPGAEHTGHGSKSDVQEHRHPLQMRENHSSAQQVREIHPGRTAGVQNLKDVGQMAHGFVDGFKDATVGLVKTSVDYLGKHNLVNDLASGTREALTTAGNYYGSHLKLGDGKGIAKDATDVGGQILDGVKNWSDNYSKASHYERGKQAGALGLAFTSGGVAEAEVAVAAVANTSKHLGRMLATGARLEEATASISTTGRMLKSVESAQKLEHAASDIKHGQAVFSKPHSSENLYNRGHGADHNYNTEGNFFKKQHHDQLEARHSVEGIKAVDKLMEVNKKSKASVDHINTVKETLLSLPAQHVSDLHKNGYTVHACDTIHDVLKTGVDRSEDVFGCLNIQSKKIVVPERADAAARTTFKELGVSTEGVVRHEVGHGLDYIHGWTDKIFDTFQNSRAGFVSEFNEKAQNVFEKWESAKLANNTAEVAALDNQLKRYSQFSEFMSMNRGPREVVADFYALAHGGTNRYPEVIDRLNQKFKAVNDTLCGQNWPAKKRFFGMF